MKLFSFSLCQRRTYSSCGRGVYVYDTSDVGPGGVDGHVWAEAYTVDTESCASLVHYISQDVHFNLKKANRQKIFRKFVTTTAI